MKYTTHYLDIFAHVTLHSHSGWSSTCLINFAQTKSKRKCLMSDCYFKLCKELIYLSMLLPVSWSKLVVLCSSCSHWLLSGAGGKCVKQELRLCEIFYINQWNTSLWKGHYTLHLGTMEEPKDQGPNQGPGTQSRARNPRTRDQSRTMDNNHYVFEWHIIRMPMVL